MLACARESLKVGSSASVVDTPVQYICRTLLLISCRAFSRTVGQKECYGKELLTFCACPNVRSSGADGHSSRDFEDNDGFCELQGDFTGFIR